MFEEVSHSALTYIQDPPQKWANLQDCVEFTCTGMYNIVMYFSGIQTAGSFRPNVPAIFNIISNNKESVSAQVISTCNLQN